MPFQRAMLFTGTPPALVRLRAIHVATAIAEWFRDQSLDVLVSLGGYHVATGRPTPDEMIERALIALDQARAGKMA